MRDAEKEVRTAYATLGHEKITAIVGSFDGSVQIFLTSKKN